MNLADFLPITETDKLDKLAGIYIKEIVSKHGVPTSIISIVIRGLRLISGIRCKKLWEPS
jgi:hypothetical protein